MILDMDSLNEKITNINKEFDSKIASLNEEREVKIAQAKAESLIESVDSLPVFNLMTIFENVSPLLLKKKGGPKLIQRYISVIKGNKNILDTLLTF